MNKALVTAMLLGLISADKEDEAAFEALRAKRAEKAPNSEDCEDAATATARAAKARAEGEKALLDTEKKRLDDLLVAETKIHDDMKVNSDAAAETTKAAREYLDVAAAANKAAEDEKSAGESTELAEKDAIAGLNQASTDAAQKVTDQKGLITAIKLEIVDLEAAVTQHSAEKVTLTKAWQDKVDAKKVITDSKDANILSKEKMIEERDGCASNCKTEVQDGTIKIETDKGTAETDAIGLVTNYKLASQDKTEATIFTALKAANKLKVRQTAYKASKTAACAAVTGATCRAGDQITELDNATWNVSSFTDYDNNKGWHDTAIGELADLKAKVLIATKDKATAVAANTKKKQDITNLESTIGADISAGQLKQEKDADDAITAPLEAKTKVEAQYDNAVIERDKAKERLTALETALAPLEVKAANAVTALADGSVKDTAAKAKIAAAKVEMDRLSPFIVAAKKAGDRATAYFNFYNDYTKDAKQRVDDTQAAINAITDKKADGKASGSTELIDAKIATAEEHVQAAITRCKRRQYSDAIASLTKFNEDEAAMKTKKEEAKKAYDDKRKKAVAKNADCRKDADGVRAECAEGECCGQANRYERDGTRMTVEVCGSAEDSTYTYWPEMKTGMAKAPATEQWRYYCIQGAANVAAGAAAVAATIFMTQ